MNESALYGAVTQLAGLMQGLPDEDLDRLWTWRDHDEGLRFALIGSYHELRHLSVTLDADRTAAGFPRTAAQHALGHYHAAYRDLEAVLLGVTDEELDKPPAEGEWPLRQVLGHIIRAERMFFTLAIVAIRQGRNGEPPSRPSAKDLETLVGSKQSFERILDQGTLPGIFGFYGDLHRRILVDLSGANEDDLQALSRFWEPEPLPVIYRLHRFDAHLRQHTIQVEKTLAAIGRRPNEARRLLRLVYNALAGAEGFLIGASEFGTAYCNGAAAAINARNEEIASIL